MTGIVTRTVANAVYVSILVGSLIASVLIGFVAVDLIFPPVAQRGSIASAAALVIAFGPLILLIGFWMALAGGGSDE